METLNGILNDSSRLVITQGKQVDGGGGVKTSQTEKTLSLPVFKLRHSTQTYFILLMKQRNISSFNS